MSNFIKYPHIDNWYQKKVIDFFAKVFPDIYNCKYTIESKLDGANLAIIVKPNSEILYASRNQIIGDLSDFYGLDSTMKKYSSELESLIQIAKDKDSICHFYCEYFGKGIQGRIDYGEEKQIRIFGLRIGEELKSPIYLYSVLKEYSLSHLLIPVLGECDGLEEALNFNEVYTTLINPDGHSYEEGIVIKPLNVMYITKLGDIFQLKKKNEKFKEKTIRQKVETEESKEISELISGFCSYINESRMFSVFSKEKEITDKSQIGHYVKLILQDAKEDYIRENNDYNEEYEKKIFGTASKLVANMLINHLR